MGLPEPPTDGRVSSLVAWVFVMVCLGIAYMGFNTLGGKMRRSTTKASSDDGPSLRVPTAGDNPDEHISMKGMTPDMASEFTKVSGALAGVVAENAELNKRMQTLESRNDTLDGRVDKLEAIKHDLIEHVTILRKGIENGTIPPLPELTENIKHLFGDLL